MKLKKIEITNFRCFKSLEIPFQPDLNVFVGVNNAGKSAILDAISIALYEVVSANGCGGEKKRAKQRTALKASDIHFPLNGKGSIPVREDFVQIRTSVSDFYKVTGVYPLHPALDFLTLSLEWTEYIQFKHPNKFSYPTKDSERLNQVFRYFDALWNEIRISGEKALIPIPVVAYYRASRRISQMPDVGDIFKVTLDRHLAFENALDAGTDYRAMCQWFYLRENAELREKLQVRNDRSFEFPDLKAVRNSIRQTVRNVSRVFFEDAPIRLKVELAEDGHDPVQYELEQLSDGYRNLVAMILDFARRLAQAHPNWENPLEAPGILLIDEIELHLHPGWQQEIIPNLQKVFPNTQLILTTHSPQILTTVESRNIFVLKDYSLHSVPKETLGAESKRVLYEIMDTASRPPKVENAEKIKELQKLINDDKLTEAQKLCQGLLEKMGPDEALIEAETTIKNRLWER